MTLKVDDILERVSNIEDERSGYRGAAALWEDMWMLKAFDRSAREALEKDKVELITTPTPYNVVQLGTRLVSSMPRIEVPTSSAEEDDEEAATKRQRFLNAFWERSNRQQRTDIIANAAWQSLVRGRHAFEVKWIKDELPPRLREKRLPILVRTLDPFNVGTRMGPYYTEYAFHKWEASRLVIKQWFPSLRWKTLGRRKKFSVNEEDEKVEIIDFWWLDDEGNVWNAIVVEGEQFGKKPFKTDYPEVPIVEGYADSAPIEDEIYKGMSILHPLKDIWPLECRETSYLATGMLYYFNPVIVGKGQDTTDIVMGPGANVLGMDKDSDLSFMQPQVNMPLVEGILSKADVMIQTSTFPNVMYGQQPGQVQAGYAINTLAQQASSRAGRIRINLESSIELVNEIVLGLIEAFADPKDGVTVWGSDEGSGDIYHEQLLPSDIDGFYENTVTLVPDVAQDESSRMAIATQGVNAELFSKETARTKVLRQQFPQDEALRIETEKAMSGELSMKTQLRALQERFPDTWPDLVRGTGYEQLAMPPQQPQQPQGMPPVPSQGGMPPGMGGGGPLSSPDVMGAGGVPPMSPAPSPGDVGGMGGAAEGGMPSNILPPQMSGQIPPELAAIINDPTLPPELKAMIQQDPLTAMEQLRAMGALPPEGMG